MPSNSSEKIGDRVTIYLRGKTWYANFQLDGKQVRKSLKTQSKKQARAQAIQLEAELQAGRYQQRSKAPTIDAASKAYVQHLRTERRAKRTIEKVELVMRRIAELAAQRKASTVLDINLPFVDAYRSARVAAGAKPKTLLNESVIIRQLVNFAIVRGLIATDPLKGIKLKKVKSAPQPCWTREEVDRILAAAAGPHRPSLVVLAETGMRFGEAQHLTWDDVDTQHNVLHIRPKDGWQPKSGDQRVVPMSPALRSLLAKLPRHSQWVLTAAPSRKYPRGDHRISERRLLKYLKGVLKPLGLRGHLHTFRHAFISHALTRRMIPEAVVRHWVGHVDADIIRQYTHVADQISQQAMMQLSASATSEPPASPVGGSTDVGELAQFQHKPRRCADGHVAS